MDKSSDTELRKSRLAVFEHVSCKNNNVPFTKNDFKRDRSKHDSPPSSECGLVIDDDDDAVVQPQRKRLRGVRLVEEPLKLICAWSQCNSVYEVYSEFVHHVNGHISNEANHTGTSEYITCLWENCSYNAPFPELLEQHVCYHAYHTMLKNVGSNVLQRMNLPKCTQADGFEIPVFVNGYRCEWENCEHKRIWTMYEFLQHLKMHISSNPKYCKKGEVIECFWQGCKYKFNSQYKLADHVRSHTKERVVACPTCGNMFATKTKFYDHCKRQMSIDLQSYQCSQCSKLFPSERLLRDHMRSHINHYKCTLCDMTCPKPSALAAHIRYRHLPERPLKCNLCEHTCVSKPDLESHLITHCSEKLLACEDCDFRCRSLFGLDRHYQVIHGQGWNQTYACHCCQKTFARGNLLTQHLIKMHDFHWPSGHSRFRYKEDTDGIFRLQTVRYESLEVTREMMRTDVKESVSQTSNAPKYNVKKEQQAADTTPNYVLMMSGETGEQNLVCPTDNNIVITINDVDDGGNIVCSEEMESVEIKVEDRNSKSKSGRRVRPRK